MNRFLLTLLCAGAAAMTLSMPLRAQQNDTKALVQGNTQFAFDLYKQLAKKDGNLFFSPYSISSALGMTYAGARGKTAEEMKATLHFDLDSARLDPAFGALVHKIQDDSSKRKFQLRVANRLFGQKGCGFDPAFLTTTEKNYGAGLQEVDFMKAAEEARKLINDWVEKQTNDKIKELIQPGVLNSDSRLVLANAIYFKAAWLKEFAKQGTQNGKFFVSADNSIETPLMHANKESRFYQDDAFSMLELPYESGEASMYVLLPKNANGLAGLEKQLSAKSLTGWIGKMTNYQVDITFPRFKVTSEFLLNDQLSALGMHEAFTGNADFSGMISHEKVAISAVIHKAFVDVNETGTEAAAATAVAISRTSIAVPPSQTATFRADHPFVYLIRDNNTGSVLFAGRLARPQ